MLLKKGRRLHGWRGLTTSPKIYAELIAEALNGELGGSHRTVKTIMRWTDSSERSAKNWLSGETGPSGFFLIRLCKTSAKVRKLVLEELNALAEPRSLSEDSRPDLVASDTNRRSLNCDSDISGDTNGTLKSLDLSPLNNRQVWFLERVGKYHPCCAEEIALKWDVSIRTAKRDISHLKALGRIKFVGARRNGHYALSRP